MQAPPFANVRASLSIFPHYTILLLAPTKKEANNGGDIGCWGKGAGGWL